MFNYQITGPDWIGSERFDIVAKAAAPAPEDQLRLMGQTLLADRFKVALHRQSKEVGSYILTVGKSGPKFHESVSEGETSIQPDQRRTLPHNVIRQTMQCPHPVAKIRQHSLNLDEIADLPGKSPCGPGRVASGAASGAGAVRGGKLPVSGLGASATGGSTGGVGGVAGAVVFGAGMSSSFLEAGGAGAGGESG